MVVVIHSFIFILVTRSAKIAFENAGYLNEPKVEVFRNMDLEKILLVKVPQRKINRRESVHFGAAIQPTPKSILKRSRSLTQINHAIQLEQQEINDDELSQNEVIDDQSNHSIQFEQQESDDDELPQNEGTDDQIDTVKASPTPNVVEIVPFNSPKTSIQTTELVQPRRLVFHETENQSGNIQAVQNTVDSSPKLGKSSMSNVNDSPNCVTKKKLPNLLPICRPQTATSQINVIPNVPVQKGTAVRMLLNRIDSVE